MRDSVRKKLSWFVAASALTCGGDQRPLPSYTLGEDIELGIITVAVTQWEEVHRTSSPLAALRPPTGEKPVAVSVRWRGLAEYAEFDRRTFVEAFLSRRLTLVDSENFQYDAVTAMPRDFYEFTAQGGSGKTAPPDWVIVFWTWVDSQDYQLHIEHPDPGEGDFDVAVVELP